MGMITSKSSEVSMAPPSNDVFVDRWEICALLMAYLLGVFGVRGVEDQPNGVNSWNPLQSGLLQLIASPSVFPLKSFDIFLYLGAAVIRQVSDGHKGLYDLTNLPSSTLGSLCQRLQSPTPSAMLSDLSITYIVKSL